MHNARTGNLKEGVDPSAAEYKSEAVVGAEGRTWQKSRLEGDWDSLATWGERATVREWCEREFANVRRGGEQ